MGVASIYSAKQGLNKNTKRQFFLPDNLGPVVQSIISLTSLLVVKMLTVLVSKISNSQVFLLKKCANAKATHIFFSKNISIYCRPYLMIKVLTIP